MMKELNEISKENPFKVPEDYFSNLTMRITGNVLSENNLTTVRKKKVIGLRTFLLAAASVALLAVAGYALFSKISSSNEDNLASANNNIYNNVYINDIDLGTLEEDVVTRNNSLQMPHVDKKDLVEFLESEEVSIFDIYEQL